MLDRLRKDVDPILGGVLVVLVLLAVGFWGYAFTAHLQPVGKVERTRARLKDGAVFFSADIQLTGQIGQVEFNRHRIAIREAFVNVLRSKSSYMVDSATAREALQCQLVREVNRVAARRIAKAITFPEFQVF